MAFGRLISTEHEFIEVLNAFPILRRNLEKMNFETEVVDEGLSVHDFFEKKHLSEEEIDIMVKKLNSDVKCYLRRG